MRLIPESSNRQDWPRLVAQIGNRSQLDIAFIKAPPPSTVTTSTTVTVNDKFVLADATSGALTITLPPVATSAGAVITIKKIDAGMNAVTIDADGAEQIDGGPDVVIGVAYAAITVYCDGSQWWIV